MQGEMEATQGFSDDLSDERTTRSTAPVPEKKQQSPNGSFAVNLAELIKDFDVHNQASSQAPVDWESSDANAEIFSTQL